MLILLSPSKTQDIETLAPTEIFTDPIFEEERWLLVQMLKSKTTEEFAKYLGISKKLLTTSNDRLETFQKRHTQKNSKQAIHLFTGFVYKPFTEISFTQRQYAYMQKHLRTLSGLYGVIRPLDLIQPYRLEMGTRGEIVVGKETYKNLYEFWKTPINNYIKKDKESSVIVNLASDEYAKILETTDFNGRWIDVSFYQKKSGVLKQATVYTKQQRGAVAVWMVSQEIKNVEEIQNYNQNGYKYSKKKSKPDHIVFVKNI